MQADVDGTGRLGNRYQHERGFAKAVDQPDLAPHLRRADDFVARRGNRLAAELQAFRVGDPAADTRLSTMMRLAIALQYGMYGIMTLIESAEG